MVPRVPAGALHLHTGHDRLIVAHQLEHARLHQRQEVVGHVVGARPRIGLRRVFPFAAAYDIPRPRKARPQPAFRVAHGESAGVIPVQVRRKHDVDVVGRDAGISERVIQIAAAIQREGAAERVVRLVPEPRVDEHRPGAADDQLTDGHLDAILVVGGKPLAPQRLGHHTEHRTAIEPERTVAHGDQFEVADGVPRDFRFQI